MGKIIINIDGHEMYFPSRDNVAVVTKAEQVCALMGEDVLNLTIESAKVIDFKIGSFVDVFGKRYTLNQLPSVKKNAFNNFSYSLTFESEQYELMDCAWLLPDNTYGDSLTGNLKTFAEVLINDNISRSRSDWELGSIPDTEIKTLNFSSQNCLQVLQNLCQNFKVEFEILRDNEKRILNFKEKIGSTFFKEFRYGRTGGAYSIERKTNTNENVVTKLYAFGSGDNLGLGYKYSRLCLPNSANKNESFITSDAAQHFFGVRENVKIFNDIKPERRGKVSTFVNFQTFRDSSMDFDLNEKNASGDTKWLIAGNNAKITFQTGNLAGYSFEILSYNHSNKEFKLAIFSDENGLSFPNRDSEAFQFALNDEYIIEAIRVPDSYIKGAENRLKTEAQKYFDEYCKPHVDYTISLNPIFIENLYNLNDSSDSVVNVFTAGDIVTIIDDDLGITAEDGRIRVNKFSRNLLDIYSYTLTLSNNVQVTNLQRVIGELSNIQQVIQMNNLADSARAKRNWKTSQEVLDTVFDAEGDYYTEKIKPNSIETQMLATGARSQQFVLKGCLIQANYAGNQNRVVVSAGTLEHYTINPEAVETWSISASDFSNLNQNQAYYIYAKCERSTSSSKRGQIIFSTSQIRFEDDPNYYHFLCGVLSSVMSDSSSDPIKNPNASRQVSLTYGSTTINGRYINTGRIQSADGGTFFDLDSGIIGGNIDFQDSVITESIYIKNGKDSQGQTQYCGAISGNESLPVMWVSENSTTDVNKVAEFANGKCPIKITKNGYGSNIGCLNIIDENATVINGASGMIKMSANSILNENAALAPLTIPDTPSEKIKPPKTEHIKVLTGRTGTYTLYGNEVTLVNGSVERIINLVNYVQNGNIKFNIIASDRYSFDSWLYPRLLLEYSNGAAWRQLFSYFGTSAKQTFTKQNSALFTLDKNFTIDSNQYTLKGKLIKIRWRLEFHFGCSNFYSGDDDEMADFMFTNFTELLTTPVIHWNNPVTANIMAAGGFTSALDSDNYFKLYPQNNKLNLDFKGSMAVQQTNVTYGSSYIQLFKVFNIVFARGHIFYGDNTHLTIPNGYRPCGDYDSRTYYGRRMSLNVQGAVVMNDLVSGTDDWFVATYIATNN